MLAAAEEWVRAGITLLQYRDKSDQAGVTLANARDIKARLSEITLIFNDRPDLCVAAGYNGVHVGQDDLSPESARQIIGRDRWLGVSTHNLDQVARAEHTSADYIAIGPVFATASKVKPDPVVGLAGVSAARKVTRKPLVAIGGITRQNCLPVIKAGADSVAVISDLVREPGKSAEEFVRILS
jgi:thiamine-phosphate pyrophosphorylase